MKAIGVLCARVRVEEKQIIVAIGVAGHAGMVVPPPSTPMPPGPASLDFAMLGIESTDQSQAEALGIVIDRCQSRTLAAVTMPILRAAGAQVIGAGLAAERTRLDVARALSQAGLPRPQALVGFSEASGTAAANLVGYPATLLPLTPGMPTTALLDADTADAVIEHRVVLGKEAEAIVLIQAGDPGDDERSIVHVVAGRAVAVDGAEVGANGVALAERAAHAVDARFVGVELAMVAGELVVWDLHPVPDFRKARLLGKETVPEAVVAYAAWLATNHRALTDVGPHAVWDAEAGHDVVLSA